MGKRKLTIPYKGNENQNLLHFLKIFIGLDIISMDDASNYRAKFRGKEALSFELFDGIDINYLESCLSDLGVIFYYNDVIP